jgi:hypothetical protein
MAARRPAAADRAVVEERMLGIQHFKQESVSDGALSI